MSTRSQNEKKFGQWEELPASGRRYRLDVPGNLGWLARYLKDVDADKMTVRFWQGKGSLLTFDTSSGRVGCRQGDGS